MTIMQRAGQFQLIVIYARTTVLFYSLLVTDNT